MTHFSQFTKSQQFVHFDVEKTRTHSLLWHDSQFEKSNWWSQAYKPTPRSSIVCRTGNFQRWCHLPICSLQERLSSQNLGRTTISVNHGSTEEGRANGEAVSLVNLDAGLVWYGLVWLCLCSPGQVREIKWEEKRSVVVNSRFCCQLEILFSFLIKICLMS